MRIRGERGQKIEKQGVRGRERADTLLLKEQCGSINIVMLSYIFINTFRSFKVHKSLLTER